MKNPPDPNKDTSALLLRLEQALAGSGSDGISNLVRVLRRGFDHYNWAGVYLVQNENPVLAGYAGDSATEHVTIPVG